MKKLLSLIGACAIGASAYAQTTEYPWAVGLYYGRTEYNGEMGNHFFDFGDDTQYPFFGSKFYGHVGLTVERNLNKNFDLMLWGSAGYYGAKKNASEFESGMINGDINLKYKFPFLMKYRVHPFVFIGAGARYIGDIDKPSKGADDIVEEGTDFVADGGLGIDFRITKHWSLRYIGMYGYGFADNHDNHECGDYDDQQLQHSIGLVYQFSCKPKDTDKDGVPDKYDECANTPAGVTVDAKGCPVDSDNDGVPDYLDACPDTPTKAKVDSTGCPIDSDGDGIPDYKDECPNTPAEAKGKINEKGCPIDSDGDGVPDYLDACPDSPAEAKGFVDSTGCPIDQDGDGIYDYEDKCPTVKGIKANKGCPEVSKATKQIFKKALNGIQFESGNAVIKKNSDKILNQIATIMTKNPEYKLTIAGHTDNSGNAEKNLKLSQDRADAVKTYLTNKGVAADRMTSTGLGDTKPVASNAKKAGRALNRRVEFEVEF